MLILILVFCRGIPEEPKFCNICGEEARLCDCRACRICYDETHWWKVCALRPQAKCVYTVIFVIHFFSLSTVSVFCEVIVMLWWRCGIAISDTYQNPGGKYLKKLYLRPLAGVYITIPKIYSPLPVNKSSPLISQIFALCAFFWPFLSLLFEIFYPYLSYFSNIRWVGGSTQHDG
jgi:hypothetical protein